MAKSQEDETKEYEHDVAIEGLEEPELDVAFEEEEEEAGSPPSTTGDEDLSEEEREAESRKDSVQEELRTLREELRAAQSGGSGDTEALRDEIRDLREQINKQSTESEAASRKAEIDREISEKREKLRQAKENGETDEELSLNDEILDLKIEARELNKAPARKEPEPTAKDTEDPSRREQPNLPPAARDWLSRNSDWFRKPEYAGATAFAIEESKRLAATIPPESDRHYRELTDRVKAKFPEVYGKGEEEEDVDKRPPHGGSGNRGTQTPQRRARNKVVLTDRDKANMQRFKLDPEDPKDVKYYAREKLALERKQG